MHLKSSRLYRMRRGASLLETLAIICVVVPIVLALIDGAIFLMALSTNDKACRAACRAASMGAPDAIRKGEPLNNARTALESFAEPKSLIQVSPECQVTESVRPPIPSPPFGGRVNGEVSVSTQTHVNLPFLCNLLRHDSMTVQTQKTFAYTWSLPSDVTRKGTEK